MRDEVASVLQVNWSGRSLAAAILCVSTLALSGCKLFVKEEPPPCPRVSILADAAKLTRFRPGPGRDVTDVVLQARLTDYHGGCHYNKDDRVMTIDLQVGMDLERGPAMGEGRQQLSYFVAVPTYFPFEGAKKTLPVMVEFPKGRQVLHISDRDVEISFPVRNIKELERYEVFVGLQMDEAELNFNRQSGRH